MCGHGMLSANFAKKMIDWVKENRRTPRGSGALHGALLHLRRIQHQQSREASSRTSLLVV